MSMSNKGNSACPRNSDYSRRLHNVGAQALELEEGEREAIRREFPLKEGARALRLKDGWF